MIKIIIYIYRNFKKKIQMSKMSMLEKRSARLYVIFKKHVIYIFPCVHRKKSFLIEKMQIIIFCMMVKLNT